MQFLSARLALSTLPVLIVLGLTACASGAVEGEVPAASDDGSAPAIDAGSEGGGANRDSATLVAAEFAYDPSSIAISAGTPVEIVLDNQGAVGHDIVLEGEDEVVNVGGRRHRKRDGDAGSRLIHLLLLSSRPSRSGHGGNNHRRIDGSTFAALGSWRS